MTLNYTRIMEAGGDYTQMDYIVGACGVLLTLEAARRVVGLPIVIIASTFLLYSYLGPYFPGFLAHRGYSIQRIVSHMYFTTEGILGIPLGVSATFIFLFILFGAFLEKTGIGKLFIEGGRHHQRFRGHRFGQLRRQHRRFRQFHHPHDEKAGVSP